MSTILSITISSAFEGSKTYTLEEDIQAGSEVKYRMTFDQSWCFNQIGVQKTVREISSLKVKRAFDEFMKTPVSICPEPVMGLDGTTTTIEIERGLNRVSYTWWEELPKEWKNLRKILKLFDI